MRRKLRWAKSLALFLATAAAGCVPEAVGQGFTTGLTDGINEIVVSILTSLVLGQG